MKTCTIDDCTGQAVSRGMCKAHYWRVTSGSTYSGPVVRRPRGSLGDRIKRMTVVDENGCWNWTGCLSAGYGRITVNGAAQQAHRISYEYFVGPLADLHIDHLCRNRRCVNPAHLEPVTIAENNRRMFAALAGQPRPPRKPVSEWKNPPARGEQSGGAKLTEAAVRAIRADTRTHRAIGAAYGINPASVSRIKSRTLWRHVQ